MLRPGGIYVLNVIDFPPLDFARAETATLLAAFDDVAVWPRRPRSPATTAATSSSSPATTGPARRARRARHGHAASPTASSAEPTAEASPATPRSSPTTTPPSTSSSRRTWRPGRRPAAVRRPCTCCDATPACRAAAADSHVPARPRGAQGARRDGAVRHQPEGGRKAEGAWRGDEGAPAPEPCCCPQADGLPAGGRADPRQRHVTWARTTRPPGPGPCGARRVAPGGPHPCRSPACSTSSSTTRRCARRSPRPRRRRST